MTLIYYKQATELASLIRSKKLSPVELIETTLNRIETLNPVLNAFVALRPEEAMEEAKHLEMRLASGEEPGPLAGIPIGVKDLEDVAGMVTTYGSIPFRGNVAKSDSIQVARLKAAGAIVVGKTNTPEFGFTGFTKNRLHGVTRNPWNRERTPGGSSGGSGAAVAAGLVPMATGSDAGGSIRIPACYCGCFGVKPSFGRIPFGPVPLLPMTRMWTLGPITRTVEDAALYLDCTAGYHPVDPEALPPPSSPYSDRLKDMPRCLRIGFSPDLGYATVHSDIMALVERAASVFERLGHRVELWKSGLPDVSRIWSDLACREIYAQLHDEFDKIRSEMGRSLVQSLDLVKKVSIKDLIREQKIRTELNHALREFFEAYDLLLTPTLPTEAFAAKGPPPGEIEGEQIPLLHAVAFTYPFNLSGHPAATVRAGLTPAGLPAGLQIVGPRQRDDLVLQAAYAYQEANPWNSLWPDLELET